MHEKRKQEVERTLDQLLPWIRTDGGEVSVVDISPRGVVTVRLGGNCVGCGSQQVTVDEGIKSVLLSQLDWVTDVVAIEDDTPVDKGPSVAAAMEQDLAHTHHLLVELDESLLAMQPGDPPPEALESWLAHFDDALLPMLEREEQCVFPVLRDFLNTAAGPVGIMLREHEDLRGKGRALREAANDYTPASETARRRLQDAGRAVSRLLSSHLIKERASVFELLDGVLPADLRNEVLQDLRRYQQRQNAGKTLAVKGAQS